MQNYSNITFDSHRAKEYFLEKTSFSIGPVELKKMMKTDLNRVNLVDLREYQDYLNGHIPFAVHLPYEQIDAHWNMFKKDELNILYSYNPYCHLAAKIAVLVAEKGYPVMELCGGFDVWENEFGFDVVTENSEDTRD